MVNILTLTGEDEKQSSLPTSTFQDTDVFKNQSSTLSPTSTTDQQKFLDGLDDSQYNKMMDYHKQGYSFDQAKDMLTSNKQEQKNYLDNLSDEQYNQMMSYYNQGYSFEEAQNKLNSGNETAKTVGGVRTRAVSGEKNWFSELLDFGNVIGEGGEYLGGKLQELGGYLHVSPEDRKADLYEKIKGLDEETKKKYQKEYNSDISIRKEFGSVENYMMWKESGILDTIIGTAKRNNGVNLGQSVANIPSSLATNVGGIIDFVTNPIDRTVGIAEMFGTEEGRDMLKNEFLTQEGLTRNINDDPLGVITTFLDGGGLALKGASTAGKFSKSSKMANLSQKLSKVANVIDDVSDFGISKAYNKVLDKGLDIMSKSKNKAVNLLGKYTELTQRPLRYLGKNADSIKSIYKEGSKLLTKKGESQKTGSQTAESLKVEVTPGAQDLANNIKEGFWEKAKNNFSSGLGEDNRLKMYSNRYFAPIAKSVMSDIDMSGAPMKESQITKKYYTELAKNVVKTIDNYADNLEETGRIYEQLRNSGVRADLSQSQMKIRQYLRENGITPVLGQDGKFELKFANDTRLLPIEMNQIQRAFDWIMSTNLKNADWDTFHSLRKDIDKKLVNWDNAGRQEQQEIVKGMRKIMNEDAHEKFPGVKKADELYHKEIDELNNIKYNLVYQTGPKKGEYKDNVSQKIKTIINNNEDRMRDRLKKYIPDIDEMAEAIELATKYGKAYQGSPALMKVLGKVVAGTAVAGSGWVNAVLGITIGAVIDKFFTENLGSKMRKKVLQEIADNIPEDMQKELADIFIRDASGYELFEGERKLRDQAIQEIVDATAQITGEEKPESFKTKAEQQAEYNKKRVTKDRGVETQNDKKYIVIDGKKEYNTNQDFSNEKIFQTKRENEKYVNNFNRLIQGKTNNAEIGDGITIDNDIIRKIYRERGAFAQENLIETVNNADGTVEHPFEQEDTEYRLKKIPGTNDFLKATLTTKDGKKEVVFFEEIKGDENTFEEEMKKSTKPLETNKEENIDEAMNFLNEMNKTESNNLKTEENIDYSRMSDDGLNALLEEKNLPKQEREMIEDILEKRIQKEIARESQRGAKGSSKDVFTKSEVDFIRRAHQLQEMEKRLGKVGKNTIKDLEKKHAQEQEFIKKREGFIEEIQNTYGIDQFDAYEKFLDFENAGLDGEQYVKRGGTKRINDYDTEVQELLNKKKEEWSKQPQHIREMDDYEKQVRQDLIDSRGDGYEIRERDGGDAFIKDGDIIGRWNYKDGQISEIIFSTDDGFDAIMNNKRFLRNLPDDTIIHKQGEELSATAKELRDVKYGNEEKGKTMYQIAYHGGPNSFDRFDLSHIGNGLQAHGYGHYVAFNENVANSYANGKNLYTLDIPDEVKKNTPTGTNYLDEQKFYSEKEYDNVFKELEKKNDLSEIQKSNLTKSIDEFRNHKGLTGENVYRIIKRTLGNKQKASEFLNSLGYDGIKYKDRNDGPCAVLFTDEAMNIVNHEKYQIADQTKTPEFKKRFEGSKVVDENGNPLVVYHGTNAKFNTFDGIKTEPGYRFTEDFDYAKEHGDNVKSVYLNIKNVADLDTMRELGKEKFGDNVGEKQLLSNEFKDYLIEKGYDGMVWDHDGKNTYIAFNPNQIKSATDNIGTFDPNNPDIRYQKFGVAKQGEKGITAQEGLGMKNFKNGRSVEEIAKHYGIETKIVDQILTPNGDKALGSYGDGLIKLAKDLKESTVPHELLHATFDMVDSQTKQKILDVVKKKLEREGKMEGIKDKDLNAEERLADSFSEYFRTGKFEDRTRPKGVMNKIKEFFKRVKDFITGVYKERKQIKKLFDDILEEKIKVEKSTSQDIKNQMAYHGSKADFDKFDSSHIGEGQGAQVHGRGHYVTKNPENAKFYAKDNMMFKGYQTHQLDSLKDFPPEGYAVITNIEDLYKDGYGTIQDCIENNQRVYDREVKRLQEEVKQDDNSYTRGLLERTEKRKEVADSLKPEDFKIPERNLYEIDIPDPIKTDTPTGSNYLDENKKITPKQYEKFKILLNDYIKENNLPSRSLDVKYEDLTSRGKAGVGGGGSAIYDVIETILGSDKKASEFLNELGYDGIKYKDGKDGDCYVIFNDDKMNIKSHEKFQIDENIKQNSEKPDAETAKEIRNIFNKYSNTLDAINTKFADYYQGTTLTEYRGKQEKLYGIIGGTYDPDVEKRQKNIYKKMGEFEDESALEKTSNGRKDVQQETVDTQDLTSLQSMFKELEQYEKYNKWIQSEPVPGPTKAFDSKGIYQDYLKAKANTPQKKKETVQKLVAISNMKEEKFKQIIKDNGKIPMPSITIMNPNIHHVDFGEIQMVFGKNTVDPKTNKDNIIYGTDAYTPNFGILAKNIVTKDDGSFINGNQFKDGKERPVTPENVLKAMQEGQKPVAINVKPGSYKDMIQIMGSKIDDLEDVRKKNFADFKFHEIIDQIQDLNKKYNKQVEQLKEEGNYQGENIRVDIKRTYNTDAKEFARKLNSQMNNRVSEETVQGLIDTIEKGRNSSIRFSESKPQRIVDVYNEVEYVLVPKNMVDGIKDLVKGTPLENKIQSYSSQGGDNRLDVTRTKRLHELQKKYGNVFFSMGGLVMPIAYLLQMMNGEDEEGQEA